MGGSSFNPLSVILNENKLIGPNYMMRSFLLRPHQALALLLDYSITLTDIIIMV